MFKKILSLAFLTFSSAVVTAQTLHPGFEKQQYIDLMKVSAQFGDSAYSAALPPPHGFHFIYRSPIVGLENCWDLWMSDDSIPVISIRGTTLSETSWLANFYAAMVPAKGLLQLTKTDTFRYDLANDPRAAVHAGWLLGMAFLAKDILPKIDSLYKAGRKQMLIIGHSQGGGIAFMLNAYLRQQQQHKVLPADIRFKTYCSAGPKPGNLYFAYEYEAATQDGWAYNVVNSADWVPETPVSIQTVNDFNTVNPFVNVKTVIRKQSFLKRLALNYAYTQLTKYNQKAVNNYRKYLGAYVVKSVKKLLPGFVEPVYAKTNNYVRTGSTIILLADEAYFKTFQQDEEKVFVNHLHPPYLYLANKLLDNTPAMDNDYLLTGTWELNYITGKRISFEGLYPGRKPFVTIDRAAQKISGNTSCNSFASTVTAGAGRIHISDSLVTTKMMCPGEGEHSFLEMLKKVNGYSASQDELTFLMDDVVIMRFSRNR